MLESIVTLWKSPQKPLFLRQTFKNNFFMEYIVDATASSVNTTIEAEIAFLQKVSMKK